MSSQVDPGAYQDRIGTVETYEIGTIRRVDARRYARAVEDDNPLFHDLEYARSQGYDDIVVPPNYPPAIIDREEGEPSSELREDGISSTFFPVPIPATAVLMGGGQELAFDRYIVAGEFVTVEETFTDLYQKTSDVMGTLTFIELTSEFFVEGDGEKEWVIQLDERYIVGDR